MSKRRRREWSKRPQRKAKPIEMVQDVPVVAVCIPSDDHVHSAFYMSSIHMLLHTAVTAGNEIALNIQHVGASILPHSRYTLVKQALKQKATHLLFIDSDMVFPPDTLLRMMRHDKDIVSINAMSRRPPYNVTAWARPGVPIRTTEHSTGLEKAWRTGFALVMIKAKVFDKLAPPYFGIDFIPERDEFRGEDYWFFDKTQDAGFELYIDQDLSRQVMHLGSFAFNPMLKESPAIKEIEEELRQKEGARDSSIDCGRPDARFTRENRAKEGAAA